MFVSEEQEELHQVFGDYFPGDPMYDYYLMLIRSMREHCSHETIMLGKCPIPTGEGFWGAASEAGLAIARVIKAAAPFIAMIPGIGTGIAMAITAGSSLASGDRIDTVALTTIESALPEKVRKTYRNAVDVGYALGRGQKVSSILLDTIRQAAKDQGGETAAATFDAGLALGQGKGLQDAGFKALYAWTKGSGAAERAARFTSDLIKANERGLSVQDFMLQQARAEFFAAVPAAKQAYDLANAIQFFIEHPEEIMNEYMADLSERLDIPVEALRAAIMCLQMMADGTLGVNPKTVTQFEPRVYEMISNLGLVEPMNTAGTATRNNDLAVKGQAIAAEYPDVAYARTKNQDIYWQRGFDIGTAVSAGFSEAGPGQNAILASIPMHPQPEGFLAARAQQYAITIKKTYTGIEGQGFQMAAVSTVGRLSAADVATRNTYQAKGAAIALTDSTVNRARNLQTDAAYQRGFDIGTGATQGMYLPGPGQTAVRNLLSVPEQVGFDVAQMLQHGLTKAKMVNSLISNDPGIASGQLIMGGIAGSGLPTDQKASTLSVVATDPNARLGAAQVIEEKKGLFTRFLEFFGLA